MGPYQRDEKIILRVAIRGGDNREHITTAMVDCGATENFIDKEYTEWNKIPLNEKMVTRRVLAMDGREVASGPVTVTLGTVSAVRRGFRSFGFRS
jgi:hypothetical protein